MRTAIKRRLAIAGATTATLGAVTTLMTGVTFGLFSASVTGGTNAFTAETVSLTKTAETLCTLGSTTPLIASQGSTGAPTSTGVTDISRDPCTLQVTYSGTQAAYLAVDISVYKPGTGTTALYDGSAHGLQLYLTDNIGTHYVFGNTGTTLNGTQFTADTTATGAPTTLPLNTGPTDFTSNMVFNATPITGSPSTVVTLSLNYAFPNDASANNYNGGVADVIMRVHVVQSVGNTITCTNITPATTNLLPGDQCNATSPFSWS